MAGSALASDLGTITPGKPLSAPLRHLFVALLGALFALLLASAWRLEGRWFVIAVVAVALCSVTLISIARLSDFMLVLLFFSVPIAGFTKWLGLDAYSDLIHGAAPVSGALGIGFVDFLLLGLYGLWLVRVLAAREHVPLRLERIDALVLLLVGAYVLSAFGAPSGELSMFAISYLIKHVLVYFYLSRNVERRHLPWLLGAFACALALEAALGVFQNRTGRLEGLILDKGAGGAELNAQYEVPGIEELHRATGTTWDSHALGLYLCMLLPFALALGFDARRSAARRLGWCALFGLGALTVALTYSRSAWVCAAVALAATAAALLFLFRDRGVLGTAVAVALAGAVAGPWLLNGIFSRLHAAPGEIMSTRFEQWEVALQIWLAHPFFGHGAGNYMLALEQYNQAGVLELPVHNVFLFVGADTGLAGVLTFFGLIAAALKRYWRVIRLCAEPQCRLALAFAAALIAYVIDGLTDPLFRECTVYLMFWFSIAFSVVLPRIAFAEPSAELPGTAARGIGT